MNSPFCSSGKLATSCLGQPRFFVEGFCPLRCGPEPMVCVEEGGHCLSGSNAVSLSVSTNYIMTKNPACHCTERVCPPPRKPSGQGTPQRRAGFFCYFSCPSRKVKVIRCWEFTVIEFVRLILFFPVTIR